MKINKTNAARILDRNKIKYELIPYEVDENDLSAQHIVAQLGEDINCVFKTLVLKGDKTGFFVCVIPGDKTVDLKKAAKLSGYRLAPVLNKNESYEKGIREGTTVLDKNLDFFKKDFSETDFWARRNLKQILEFIWSEK